MTQRRAAGRCAARVRLVAALLALASLGASAQSADAEVLKVDKAGGRLTLKHGGIRNLDMPPMTLAFRVRDRAWLDQLAAGDKVRFDAEKVDGQYTVTALTRLP